MLTSLIITPPRSANFEFLSSDIWLSISSCVAIKIVYYAFDFLMGLQFCPLIHAVWRNSIIHLQDSPVFNYLNSLSPIKPVKSIHITQSFNSLSFASLPSVFTSPHVTSHKDSRFLRRWLTILLSFLSFISAKLTFSFSLIFFFVVFFLGISSQIQQN